MVSRLAWSVDLYYSISSLCLESKNTENKHFIIYRGEYWFYAIFCEVTNNVYWIGTSRIGIHELHPMPANCCCIFTWWVFYHSILQMIVNIQIYVWIPIYSLVLAYHYFTTYHTLFCPFQSVDTINWGTHYMCLHSIMSAHIFPSNLAFLLIVGLWKENNKRQ